MTTRARKKKVRSSIDRQAIHRVLAGRVDARGRVRIHQGELAKDLGIGMFTLNRILNQFQREGRIRRIQNLSNNVGLYEVMDPRLWRWRFNERDNS